jgi:hypothetical protein
MQKTPDSKSAQLPVAFCLITCENLLDFPYKQTSLIDIYDFSHEAELLGVTSPARKRETPLSEMSPTSIQTNPHNIRLWPFCVFNLALQALLCHPVYFHAQNTVLAVLVVVLSRAASGATVVPTPARSPPTPFSATRSCYGHRYNRGERHP